MIYLRYWHSNKVQIDSTISLLELYYFMGSSSCLLSILMSTRWCSLNILEQAVKYTRAEQYSLRSICLLLEESPLHVVLNIVNEHTRASYIIPYNILNQGNSRFDLHVIARSSSISAYSSIIYLLNRFISAEIEKRNSQALLPFRRCRISNPLLAVLLANRNEIYRSGCIGYFLRNLNNMIKYRLKYILI